MILFFRKQERLRRRIKLIIHPYDDTYDKSKVAPTRICQEIHPTSPSKATISAHYDGMSDILLSFLQEYHSDGGDGIKYSPILSQL